MVTLPSLSLQAPKVLVLPKTAQPPIGVRWIEPPLVPVPVSLAEMLEEVMPAAGPFDAVITPSYERNSMTVPLGFTRAKPSLGPFCRPSCGYENTSVPRPPH